MPNPAKKRKFKIAALLYGLGSVAMLCRLLLRDAFWTGLAGGLALGLFVSGIAMIMQARAEAD